eukprot:8878915-Karenia_brevis.AAC.1
MLQEKSSEFQLGLWLGAIDFQKAFDTISHSAIWAALEDQGVEPYFISLIMKLYANQVGQICTDRVSKTFSIRRGTKQGDPLSTLLFNSVLEHIMRPLQAKWESEGMGFSIGDESTRALTNV